GISKNKENMSSKKEQVFIFMILFLDHIEWSSQIAIRNEYCMDIVVAIDTGCSVDLANPNPKELVSRLMVNLKLSSNHTRFGIILYNKVVENKMFLDDYTNRVEYLLALHYLKLGRIGCGSRAHRAMDMSWSTMFTVQNGARGPEIPKVFILITDGVMHPNKVKKAIKEAAILKSNGVHVIIIGLKSTKYENYNSSDTFLSIATNSSYITMGYESTIDNPNDFPYFTPYLTDNIFPNISFCPSDSDIPLSGDDDVGNHNDGGEGKTGERQITTQPKDASPTASPHEGIPTRPKPTTPARRTRPPPTLGWGLIPRFPLGRK
ncbi:unnamed protein product, partial [Owenia fusiformis]